jgi:hypothetical protein
MRDSAVLPVCKCNYGWVCNQLIINPIIWTRTHLISDVHVTIHLFWYPLYVVSITINTFFCTTSVARECNYWATSVLLPTAPDGLYLKRKYTNFYRVLLLCVTVQWILFLTNSSSSRCVEVWRYSSTILDLSTRCRWVVIFPSQPLYPRSKSPGTHCLGDWVGPRASVDTVEYIACCYTDWAILAPLYGQVPFLTALVSFII